MESNLNESGGHKLFLFANLFPLGLKNPIWLPRPSSHINSPFGPLFMTDYSIYVNCKN